MKILLTADPEIPVPPIHYGGIERIVDILIQGLVAKGHDVTLIAHSDSKVPCKLIPWKHIKSNGLKSMVRNTGALAYQHFTQKFDIIHSFSRLAYLSPLLPFGVPKIMSYQREPTLSQIKKAAKFAKKNTLLFTGCSNYITNQIKPFASARTVYNFVPIERYDFTASVEEDAPLVFLGRIEPIKGTHIAIEVARKTGRALIIAGNIPQEGQLYFEEQIKPYLNHKITYVGPINDVQKNKILGKAAAFLMPIQWNEPFGIVMAEAMACGTPVIGFAFGSVPEVVEHNITGFVCNNVDQMVESINSIKEIDRSLVRRATENRFSNTVIVKEYLNLYHEHIVNTRRFQNQSTKQNSM